jgi:hypothetical protein
MKETLLRLSFLALSFPVACLGAVGSGTTSCQRYQNTITTSAGAPSDTDNLYAHFYAINTQTSAFGDLVFGYGNWVERTSAINTIRQASPGNVDKLTSTVNSLLCFKF